MVDIFCLLIVYAGNFHKINIEVVHHFQAIIIISINACNIDVQMFVKYLAILGSTRNRIMIILLFTIIVTFEMVKGSLS